MRDEDGGVASLLLHLLNQLPHLLAEAGVEGAQGLVQEQQARLGDERARQRHPLLLAAGELAGTAVSEALHPHPPERRIDAAGDLIPRNTSHPEPEADVRGDAHVREEQGLLKDHRDTPLLRRYGQHRVPVHENVTGGGADETGYYLQRRRLAAARGSEEGDELPRPDFDGETRERGRAVPPIAVREIPQLQTGAH